MRYLSVCSGIEAATVAWHALNWQPIGFSEVEAFPSAVLRHHYPTVPNFGDMTQFERWPNADVDVLVGGTPCQSFSVAGLRKGLDDPRGNLMLTFGAIANRFRPRWLVWENVPGVLSSNGGRDFGTFLGMLGELGYGFAYRVLDAQYFGVAQRRRRVFVIGCLGDWRSAAAVLFERYSLSGDTAPSREKGKAIAGTIEASLGRSRGAGTPTAAIQPYPIANALTARMHKGINSTVDEGQTPVITHSLRGEGFDASEDGTGRGTPLVPVNAVAYSVRLANTGANGWGLQENVTHTLDSTNGPAVAVSIYQDSEYGAAEYPTAGSLRAGQIPEHQMVVQATAAVTMRESGQGYWMQDDIAGTLRAEGEDRQSRPSHVIGVPIAFAQNQRDEVRVMDVAGAVAFQVGPQSGEFTDVAPTLDCRAKNGPIQNQLGAGVMQAMQVRRLTPVECERLQGFPDNYTNIPWRGKPDSPDGPRYKALGNSMAVPVMRWIGNRIALVDQLRQPDRNNSLYDLGNRT